MSQDISFVHTAPWYTSDLHKIKSMGRHLERLSKKTGLTVHKDRYSDHILKYKNGLSVVKTSYYSKIISVGEENTRAIFFNSKIEIINQQLMC